MATSTTRDLLYALAKRQALLDMVSEGWLATTQKPKALKADPVDTALVKRNTLHILTSLKVDLS